MWQIFGRIMIALPFDEDTELIVKRKHLYHKELAAFVDCSQFQKIASPANILALKKEKDMNTLSVTEI